MLRSTLPLFVLATATALACSVTVVQDGPVTQPVVRFEGTANAFMGIPFPSDAYLQNGKVVPLPAMEGVVKQNSAFLQHSLAQMDGFSRTAMSVFFLDDLAKPLDDDGVRPTALVDVASLPASEAQCMSDGSSVFFLDLAATDPSRARIPCRAAFHAPKGTKTRPVLGVGPGRGILLEEGHQYAAVVTNRVKTKDGVTLGGTSDWTQATKGDRRNPLGNLYGPAYDKAKTLLAGALLGTDEIVGMTVFTTTKMGQELFALRDQLEDAAPAVLKWDDNSVAPMKAARFVAGDLGPLPTGFTATLDDWLGVVDAKNKLPNGVDDPDSKLPVHAHDKIAVVGTAEFDGINYLQVKPLGYEDVEHANFARDGAGKPIPAPEKPTNKIWATFFVPRGTMPAKGWPIVILQHGLSSSRAYALDLANVFCAEGWAVVAIDSVTFGARAADPKYQKDDHTNWEKAPGAKYVGGDGIGDPDDKGATNGSFDLFGGLKNIGALRDQLRQAGFDTAQLVKLLRSNPDLAPLKVGTDAPKIDGDAIAYVGDSLGGIEGAIAAGIEPNVKAWVLNVAGGSLVQELGTHSPVVSNQLNLAGAFNFGFQSDQFTESHLLTTLVQTIEDPGDPLFYAQALQLLPHPLKGTPTKPRNVLQIEVLFDEVVANESNEALARAAGFPLATPNVGSNAAIRDLKAPDANPARIVFPEAKPDANGVIKDAPGAGYTAVLIQTAPSQHGADLTTKSCRHEYKAPWALFDTNEPFTHFDATQQYGVTCAYLETQATVTQFVKTAFAGGAPEIKGFKAPVRDLDGDGTLDATDPDPNDPKVK
jgi:dienelactone hydrolase